MGFHMEYPNRKDWRKDETAREDATKTRKRKPYKLLKLLTRETELRQDGNTTVSDDDLIDAMYTALVSDT